MRRLLDAYWPWWIILTMPGAYWTYGYWRGTTFYGEYLHATGELGAVLLISTLAVTPLRLIFPGTALAGWLLARRRHLGVVTFVYSVLHAGAYVVRQPVERVVEEAAGIAMLTGWLALVLLLPLAVTSNDASERLMKRGWKTLHRTVYVIAVLTFAHWILAAFNPIRGYICLGVLAVVEGFRVWRISVNRRTAEKSRGASEGRFPRLSTDRCGFGEFSTDKHPDSATVKHPDSAPKPTVKHPDTQVVKEQVVKPQVVSTARAVDKLAEEERPEKSKPKPSL